MRGAGSTGLRMPRRLRRRGSGVLQRPRRPRPPRPGTGPLPPARARSCGTTFPARRLPRRQGRPGPLVVRPRARRRRYRRRRPTPHLPASHGGARSYARRCAWRWRLPATLSGASVVTPLPTLRAAPAGHQSGGASTDRFLMRSRRRPAGASPLPSLVTVGRLFSSKTPYAPCLRQKTVF